MSPNIVRVTVAALFAAAALLYVRWSRDQARNAPVAPKINCLNNLRQIGLAFRSWSVNHDGQYPFNVSTNSGGTRELVSLGGDGFDVNTALHFQVLTNEDELRTPILLVCPQDQSKKPASKFSELRPENVTYRLRTAKIDRDSPKQILAVCPVDGNTLYLGVADSKGFARVDDLNSPKETRKMATIPDGSQSPIMTTPVSKEDITRMIEADGGIRFPSHEIRMTPSGLSGSLNGGVIVNVGGDPRNGASWKYDLVFGPDSQLAFYLRGAN